MVTARKNNPLISRQVVPFVDRVTLDCQKNLKRLISTAKNLIPLGEFEFNSWEDNTWKIVSGPLISGLMESSSYRTLYFTASKKLNRQPLNQDSADLLKALFLLEYERKKRSLALFKQYLSTWSYILFELEKRQLPFSSLTPEIIEAAVNRIGNSYRGKGIDDRIIYINIFAKICNANKLCKVHFIGNFKYVLNLEPSELEKSINDPILLETTHEKVLSQDVFIVLGELYRNVPKDHPGRVYVLILTLLACTGRRVSEILRLPNQQVQVDENGDLYLEYYPRKQAAVNAPKPKERLQLLSQFKEIVRDTVAELQTLCESARDIAAAMHKAQGPDLRFLSGINGRKKLYKADLEMLGINSDILSKKKYYAHKNGLIEYAQDGQAFITLKSLKVFCGKNVTNRMLEPIVNNTLDQHLFMKDMLLVRQHRQEPWIANIFYGVDITSFITKRDRLNIEQLVGEFCQTELKQHITSHKFRHTLNTLLDEGGLTDLVQAEYFKRQGGNPKQNKPYQHTSPQKKALIINERILKGETGGRIPDFAANLPKTKQAAYLESQVTAVQDVGTGFCVHPFSQSPCPKQLQCLANCQKYLWLKGDTDEERIHEVKRQYAIEVINRRTRENYAQNEDPELSLDWVANSDQVLATLSKQMKDMGIEEFDLDEFYEKYGED